MALLLASCGGSSGSASSERAATSSAAPPASSSSTTHTAAVTSSATSTASTTTAVVARPPECVASDLTASFLGQNGGLGHGELGFALRNASARTCRTGGYPGVQFLRATGAPLPTSSSRVTRDFFGSTPVVALTLAPGQTASFRLAVSHVATAAQTCATAGALQVIAPNDTATLHVAIPDGAYQCGTATVSPLRPGTSAYAG